MKKLNNMGFVSGGYIFDILDRFAQIAIRTDYPYVMTEKAEIQFLKQCCDPNDLGVVVKCHKNIMVVRNRWAVEVMAVSIGTPSTIYATAKFTFVGKTHSYCETKEKQNGTKNNDRARNKKLARRTRKNF